MLEKLLLKTVGVMSKKNIVRTCNSIGEEIAMVTRAEKELTPERVMEILAKQIGKKNTEKIIVTADKDVFIKFVTENELMERDAAEAFFENSVSAVVPSPKQKKTLLSLRLNDMTPEAAVNTASHELEHILFEIFSLSSKINDLLIKLKGQKWLDKYIAKYANKINTASLGLQSDLVIYGNMAPTALGGHIEAANLVEHMGLKSDEQLTKLIKHILLYYKNPKDPNLNYKILESLKYALIDESRAYKIGGRAERCYEAANTQIPNKGNTRSEVLAELFDLTVAQLKKDVKTARKAYYKDKLRKMFHFWKKEQKIE